ncbi:MAG: tRNA threonylcarbamoyladenosine dehydratase [Treponemataceae bacterium]
MQEKNIFYKSELLLGEKYYEKLNRKTVCIFGLGGVGGYVAETLVRSGIQNFILVDGDTVEITNLNRQIIATRSNLGRSKCECFKERMLDINNACTIKLVQKFLLPESPELAEIFSSKIDYVVDAVDTMALKVAIAKICQEKNINLIAATGCGNRIKAEYIFADIYKTSHCPVCKILRKLLKEVGVHSLKVLYSPSKAQKISPTASVPWTPAIAGLMLASELVLDLLKSES